MTEEPKASTNQSLRSPASGSARFPRAARLKRRALIAPLFDRSRDDVRSVSSKTVRLTFLLVEGAPDEGAPVQAGFAVSRGIRKAVDRNRIKRVMREAFRVRLGGIREMLSGQEGMLTIMFIYRGGASTPNHDIRANVSNCIDALMARLRTRSPLGGQGGRSTT